MTIKGVKTTENTVFKLKMILFKVRNTTFSIQKHMKAH